MFGTYRAFLALMVVALHLGGVPAIGAYAVFGFYILSGYLMTLIMHKNYGYTTSGLYKYAKNRVLRIYPIYWVSIAFSAILILLVGEEFSSNFNESLYIPHNFTDTIKNIFLIFPYRESPRLTPPAWALTVEIFYYILIGLGLSKNKLVVVLWVLISVIYHIVVMAMNLGWEYRYFTIPAASLPFATGALIYHYKKTLLELLHCLHIKINEKLPYIIILGILLNWLIGYIFVNSKGIFFYSNFILCGFMVVALSGRKSLPCISSKFDKWMGDFSYPIYLIHYQVGLIVVSLLSMVGLNYSAPNLTVMFFSIPFILVLSWIIIIAVEKPIELLRDKVKRS